MAKRKKEVNELETIESFFTTDNEHYNEYAFNLYKEAAENNLFSDLEIPLRFFSDYTDIFDTYRAKPLQVVKQLMAAIKEKRLNKKQQVFILEHLISWFRGTSFFDEKGKEYSMKTIKEILTQRKESLQLLNKTKPKPVNKFDFDEVKKHLQALPDTKSKIKYLTEIKTEYKQQDTGAVSWGTPFDKQCQLEIEKLKALADLEKHSEQSKLKPQFRLSNSLSKIDYIRIINALSELRCFQKEDGTLPTKQDVMKAFGDIIGVDLSSYANDLNKAFNSNVKVEQNIEIFERLKAKTQDLYLNRQNKVK
jgi:hypothetical protein